MSLSQLDSDGSRLASLGADGVLSVWSHVQGNIPVLGQKVSWKAFLIFLSVMYISVSAGDLVSPLRGPLVSGLVRPGE